MKMPAGDFLKVCYITTLSRHFYLSKFHFTPRILVQLSPVLILSVTFNGSYQVFQDKKHHDIEVKIIMSENDPANLRLYEAFCVRKYKPTLNSREECTELTDPLL